MSEAKLPGVALFELGYTDLVSVVPPDATLSPESKISADQRGKVPGRRNRNGTWGGYDWRRHATTLADARRWSIDGANLGLRSGRFPGLDIDTLDEGLAEELQRIAFEVLGPAPVRIGRPPKRLLVYRAAEPFARMRMFIEDTARGVTHLVEMLGEGQQYLVHGTHPITRRPYEWLGAGLPPAAALLTIDADKARRFFEHASASLATLGYVIRREGDGRRSTRAAADQGALAAPSIEKLRAAVDLIPNNDELFVGRDEYIRMGYAIRAAAGPEHEDEGYTIFASWAARHEADGRVTGNPETWRGDWRRMRPPYSVGWDWIAGMARGYGFDDARDEFEAFGLPPEDDPPPGPPMVQLSDRWLADSVVKLRGDSLRYSPESGRWYVWSGRRWEPDNLLRARDEVGNALAEIASALRSQATGKTARAAASRESRRIESVSVLDSVTKLVQARGEIAVRQDSLDADHWLLNTPSGAVDLKTGTLALARPEQLATKLTAVGPDFNVAATLWEKFLLEAAGGDADLVSYLRRLAGYVLTGETREQILVFIWGPGGNGKGVFLDTIRNVMGDYAKAAAMDAFTATKWDRHTTDLADLVGARLVTASETQADRAWDEQRVKQLTGGDPIKARFMRQDNFQYTPTFKLVFIGNHKPAIRDLDTAMRRRFHLVPFTVTPVTDDKQLRVKLKAEYPAILAWMIEGALEWQKVGLVPPTAVLDATTEYLADVDVVGRWLEERTIETPGAQTSAIDLFESWREWCGTVGEYAGSQRRLGEALSRRFHRTKTKDGKKLYEGITLKEITWPGK